MGVLSHGDGVNLKVKVKLVSYHSSRVVWTEKEGVVV